MASDFQHRPEPSRQPDCRDDAMRLFRDAILSEIDRLDVSSLLRRKWFLVPFEIGPQIDTQLATRLCELARSELLKSGHTDLLAVQVKPIPVHEGGEPDAVVMLPSSADPLEEWAVHECWADWVITTRACEFAAICYGLQDYDLILGQRDIVEFILGMTVEEGIKAFERFARDYDYRPYDALHRDVIYLAKQTLRGH